MGQTLCTHAYKWKNGPVKTIPGTGKERDEGEWWRGEFNHAVRTFVNAIIPHPAQQ
jgi:hypothetical protein